MQQRRQSEADEHGQHSDERDGQRRERRRGQFGSDQIPQQPRKTGLREIAQQRADGHREDRQQGQFDDGNRQHEALRGSHALHQCHGIDVPCRIASGAHRHRHRGQQHGREAGQIEKSTGTVDGGVELPARFIHLAQTLARRLSRHHVLAKIGYRGRGPCEQAGVGHTAAGLDQLGRCHIVIVEQRGGCEIHEARALIRPVVEHLRHSKRGSADSQRRPERDFQLGDDARVDPHFAAPRYAVGGACGTEGCIRDADVAAQRVARRHRVERRQLARGSTEYGGRKGQDSRASEAPGLRLGEIALRDGAGRFQTQIGREHFRRLRAHPLRDAAGKEADGRQG